MAAEPKDALSRGLVHLYESGEYSDLTVKCGLRSFKVHKSVLCPRSKYFATACRKGTFKEGQEGVITLKAVDNGPDADNDAADDPHAVEMMMEYFYRMDHKVSDLASPTKRLG